MLRKIVIKANKFILITQNKAAEAMNKISI